MLIQTPFKSLTSTSTRRRPTRRRSPASRLCLEALEDRRLMSTFSVLNLLDSGPGSLREAITAANSAPGADLIRFAPAARDGTIALTSGQLSITDDLTHRRPGRRPAGRQRQRRQPGLPDRQRRGGEHRRPDRHPRAGRWAGRRHPERRHPDPLPRRPVRQPGRRPPGREPAVVDAFGGGIFNTGTLTVRHSRFVHNRSIGADGTPGGTGSSALGGAIMSNGTASAPATATVSHSTFLDNQAVGGAAGAGASRAGIGGAIIERHRHLHRQPQCVPRQSGRRRARQRRPGRLRRGLGRRHRERRSLRRRDPLRQSQHADEQPGRRRGRRHRHRCANRQGRRDRELHFRGSSPLP